MKLNLVISLFFVFFVGIFGYAQTYNYTYTDPCTGNLQTIVVPINGEITVGYYGFIETFSYNDFTGGAFETWASGIFAQYNGNSPCSEIVGIGTTVDVTQSTALNVIGILNSLTAISDLAGATNILGGSLNSLSNSPGGENNNENKNKNKNNGNNNVNSNSVNPSGNSSNVNSSGTQNPNPEGTSQGGTETSSSQTSGNPEGSSSPSSSVSTEQGNGGETSSTTPGSEGTGTEGNGTSQQGSEGTSQNQENPQTTPEEGQGKTNITAGATNTTKAANSEGGKPSVVASSDFVGFNFKNSEVNYGAKATGGYTALRWDGQRSWGGLADYTSALKGPNITGFYAWVKPRAITLASSTITIGFEGNKSLYGTLAGGQMFTFPKIPRFKAVYMGTVSYGFVYREQFIGTAVIAGVMYDMKIGKRIDIKLMNLFVYSPYVSYYNDLVLQSPYVMLPSIGTNIGITKRFKFNINGGGAWDLKTAALNYTVTCGTRLLIGQ